MQIGHDNMFFNCNPGLIRPFLVERNKKLGRLLQKYCLDGS